MLYNLQNTRSRHAMRHRRVESMGKQMNATNHRTITWGWLAGLTAVASSLFLSQLAGQTPSPQAPATDTNQQPGPTIKAESRLVLVDAVVTDKKGNYVHDLTRNDFNVYEDDKKQSVASFSFGADAAIQPQEQKRYLILFFDTMSKLDQIQAKAAAIKFIDANAGPDRLMAVVEFGGILRTAQSFTAEADLLRAAATGMKTSSVNPNGKEPQEAEYGARVMLLSVRTLARNLSGFPGRKMVVLFSSGFLLSSTTRVDLMAAISDCNKANVAVYVLDARALLASPPGASSLLQHREEDQRAVAARSAETRLHGGARFVLASYSAAIPNPQRPGGGGGTGGGGAGGGGTGGGGSGGRGGSGGTGGGPVPSTNPNTALTTLTPPTTILPSFPPSVTTHQQVLAMLAGGTGGFTIFNTNDLLGGLEKIARERNEFYILGYAPPLTREAGAPEDRNQIAADVVTQNLSGPRRGAQQTQKGLDGGRFACAVAPQKPVDRPARNPKIQTVDGAGLTEKLRETLSVNRQIAHLFSPTPPSSPSRSFTTSPAGRRS
jgi:VWFA-related protein